jgi:hypothetical protein
VAAADADVNVPLASEEEEEEKTDSIIERRLDELELELGGSREARAGDAPRFAFACGDWSIATARVACVLNFSLSELPSDATCSNFSATAGCRIAVCTSDTTESNALFTEFWFVLRFRFAV